MKKTVWLPFFIISLLLSSCLPSGGAAPQEAMGVETIVAATYAAISVQTQAAQPLASPTVLNTAIPIETESITPTVTMTHTPSFVLASFTPRPTETPIPSITPTFSSSGPYQCEFVSQNPGNGTVFSPREEFKLLWTTKNVGPKEWVQANVQYYYLSGDKLHKREIYKIPETTYTDEVVSLRIDMVAPKLPGSYETTWAMKRGQQIFCATTFKITVKK